MLRFMCIKQYFNSFISKPLCVVLWRCSIDSPIASHIPYARNELFSNTRNELALRCFYIKYNIHLIYDLRIGSTAVVFFGRCCELSSQIRWKSE